MRARAFGRSTPLEVILRHRRVYNTDHPDVFEVIGRNPHGKGLGSSLRPYRVALIREPLKAVCNCEAGINGAACWHAVLVIRRRVGGSYAGVRGHAGGEAPPSAGHPQGAAQPAGTAVAGVG